MQNDFDKFKIFVNDLSNWLDSIPPYQYSLYATIIGYLIATFLNTGAMNSLGNWLEQVGQIMLTISAQQSATPSSDDYNQLLTEVNNLRKELDELKNKL